MNTTIYNFENIRTLFTEGFSAAELRRFCFETSGFGPVYNQLAQDTGKTEIIDRLIEYVKQRLLVETLLAWAKEHNPARFERHQPYVLPISDTLSFVNRERELETLLQNLTNPAGEHFWLILAPPHLGKSWLLQKLATQLVAQENNSWGIKYIDLRKEPLEARIDADMLLNVFFELGSNVRIDRDAITQIAINIARSRQSWLCILDSAELLEEAASIPLRQHLGQIHETLSQAGHTDIRLTFVAASRRRHSEWQGISPMPRFSHLTLTHFNTPVVNRALRDKVSGRKFGDDWLQQNAERLRWETEGLPALLVKYMDWLEQREFIRPERIQTPTVFEALAQPYARARLLSVDSLLPLGGSRLADKRIVLEQALLRLSTFRLFTQSHLKRVVEGDPDFQIVLSNLRWTIDDLWEAIGNTYLIQPVDDPWRVLHPAIRRLLFRYHCSLSAAQRQAHQQAGEFYQGWWNGVPTGKEQSVVLVERLWHQAEYLRLADNGLDKTQEFIQFAENLFGQVILPRGYSLKELVYYIEERMSSDVEFQETVGAIKRDLLGRLLEIAAHVKGGPR